MARARSARRFLVALVALAALVGTTAPGAAAGEDKPSVLFVGDSLSQNIAEGLIKHSQAKVNAINGGTVNCTVTKGTLQGYKNQILYSGCQNWETDFAAAVEQHSPDVVVLVTGGWEIVNRWFGAPQGPALTITDAEFANHYRDALRQATQVLSAGGAKVVLLTVPYMDPPHPYPEPGSGAGVLDEMWWEPYGPTEAPAEWVAPTPDAPFVPSKVKIDAANDVIRSVGDEGIAEVLDLNKKICPGGKYREKVKGKSVRIEDRIHLSAAGQKLVAKWLAPKLRKIAEG